MRTDLADNLRTEWPTLWSDDLEKLDDIHVDALVELFESILRLNSIDATSDRFITPVKLDFTIHDGKATVGETPTSPRSFWTRARRNALEDAVLKFNAAAGGSHD